MHPCWQCVWNMAEMRHFLWMQTDVHLWLLLIVTCLKPRCVSALFKWAVQSPDFQMAFASSSSAHHEMWFPNRAVIWKWPPQQHNKTQGCLLLRDVLKGEDKPGASLANPSWDLGCLPNGLKIQSGQQWYRNCWKNSLKSPKTFYLENSTMLWLS